MSVHRTDPANVRLLLIRNFQDQPRSSVFIDFKDRKHHCNLTGLPWFDLTTVPNRDSPPKLCKRVESEPTFSPNTAYTERERGVGFCRAEQTFVLSVCFLLAVTGVLVVFRYLKHCCVAVQNGVLPRKPPAIVPALLLLQRQQLVGGYYWYRLGLGIFAPEA